MKSPSDSPARSRVTYDAIAERAGVSKTTVSLVLRGNSNHRIPESTLQRVQEAANELGYYPNRLIRAMQQGKTETLGVVAPPTALEHAGRILDGIRSQAASLGYGILLAQASADEAEERESAHRLLEHRVDGMIRFTGVADGVEPPDWLTEAVGRGVPCVVVDDVMLSGKVDCIVSDDEPAAYALVSKMLPECRRILHFAGDEFRTSGRDREAGFWRALSEHPNVEGEVVSRDYSCPELSLILDREFASPTPPDRIFCATDYLAIGCLHWLSRQPRDVAAQVVVAGFGGLEFARQTDLPTVFQPFEEMGRRAVEQVIRRIQGDTSPYCTLRIPADLVAS